MRVKHQVSIILILLYFLQVPWPPGNNVCSPYQHLSLQMAFPLHNSYTLCVPDNTIIKVIHKHNIRTVFLPLVVWGFLKLFWTLSISLPAFSSRSFKWFIKVSMCTWLPFLSSFCPASLSHVSITFPTTSMLVGWIVLYCGGDNIFYNLHKHKYKHTKIYTNALNIHKSNMCVCVYICMYKHSKYKQHYTVHNVYTV